MRRPASPQEELDSTPSTVQEDKLLPHPGREKQKGYQQMDEEETNSSYIKGGCEREDTENLYEFERNNNKNNKVVK